MKRKKLQFVFFLFLIGISSQAKSEEPLPKPLEQVNIEQMLGKSISLDLTFQNEEGKTVALGQFFKEKQPVVLMLVYYECPNICSHLLKGALEGFQKLDWSIGKEFQVVIVSIDPKEESSLALSKKETLLKEYGRSEGSEGWNLLVGKEENIKELASEIGFRYRYDEETKQYAHPAALFVLTPEGKLARVLSNIQFSKRDLKLALLEASEGKIGTIIDRFLLFCYRYDSHKNKYTLFASNLMKGGAALTLFALGYLIFRMNRGGRQ